jgi:hypothetical protein
MNLLLSMGQQRHAEMTTSNVWQSRDKASMTVGHYSLPHIVVSRSVVPMFDVVGTTANSVGALALRGGAGDATLDLERVTLRLEGLDTYTVICAIVLSAIMDVYSGCETKKFSSRSERIAQYVHAFCTTTSVLSTLYVIVLFSLLTLYAKTAVGMNADEVYLKLLVDTSTYRYVGFQAFVISLGAFEFAFVVNIFLNFRGRLRWLFSGMAAIGTVLCVKEWMVVFRCASTYIFKT